MPDTHFLQFQTATDAVHMDRREIAARAFINRNLVDVRQFTQQNSRLVFSGGTFSHRLSRRFTVIYLTPDIIAEQLFPQLFSLESNQFRIPSWYTEIDKIPQSAVHE